MTPEIVAGLALGIAVIALIVAWAAYWRPRRIVHLHLEVYARDAIASEEIADRITVALEEILNAEGKQ